MRDRAAALSAAGKLAHEARELRHLGWDRGTVLNLADLATKTVATIAALRGNADARATAAAALIVMAEIVRSSVA